MWISRRHVMNAIHGIYWHTMMLNLAHIWVVIHKMSWMRCHRQIVIDKMSWKDSSGQASFRVSIPCTERLHWCNVWGLAWDIMDEPTWTSHWGWAITDESSWTNHHELACMTSSYKLCMKIFGDDVINMTINLTWPRNQCDDAIGMMMLSAW